MKHQNDKKPNWYSAGRFYLKRCFVCAPSPGKENMKHAIATGKCSWCGWDVNELEGNK